MTLPDADSLSTYGGPYANYGVGPVDPTTDLDANLFNKVLANVAMASRMVDRCEVAFVYNGTSVTVSSWEAIWKGVTTTSPIVSRSSTGVYLVTWPSTVQDELLASHALNMTSAFGWAQGSQAYDVQAQASANTLSVYTFSASGLSADATNVTIRVRAR